MSTDHYINATDRLHDALDASADGFLDDESRSLDFAQVEATLALVEQLRILTETVSDLKPRSRAEQMLRHITTLAEAGNASPGQCTDCGHNADVHDEEDGHCTIRDEERSCGCMGFEARS